LYHRQMWYIKSTSFYNIYYAVQPDLPKQRPLLHPHLLIPFEILFSDTNLFAEHFLGLPAYIDLRDIAGDIECVRFERGLLDIGIEAAGTTHTDFIATHDVRHEHLVVDGLTLVDILIHVVVAGLVKD